MITSSQFGLRNSIFDRCFWAVADGFLEAHLVPGTVQPKSQVHVLKVRAELFREAAEPEKQFTPVKGTGAAGAEDGTGTEVTFL